MHPNFAGVIEVRRLSNYSDHLQGRLSSRNELAHGYGCANRDREAIILPSATRTSNALLPPVPPSCTVVVDHCFLATSAGDLKPVQSDRSREQEDKY